jgi:hypothetical protein
MSAIWRFLVRYAPYVYLTRFPLLLAGFLLAFVPVALVWVKPLFRSMLIQDFSGVLWTTFATWLAAFTVMATRRVTLLHGALRFNCEPLIERPTHVGVREAFVHAFVAIPLIAAVGWLSATENQLAWLTVPAVLGGTVLAVVAVLAAIALQAWVIAPRAAVPAVAVSTHYRWVERLSRRPSPIPLLKAAIAGMLARLAPYLGPGYFEPGTTSLLPGHAFATGLLTVYTVFYGGAYWWWSPERAAGTTAPALVLLVVVVTLLTWILAGLAFFFDLYRLPVLMPLAIWSVAIGQLPFIHSDHYFALRDAGSGIDARLEDPYAIASRRTHPLLTVVAIDGGGIQAAAWGARVLTGIYEAWPEFQASVRFISSVSGGSVGTMYFLEALDRDPARPETLALVRTMAERSSLSEAAWGLAYPDLWRTVLPIPPWFRFEKDRGWALQRAWARGWTGANRGLASWLDGVREGWRPAVAFNATDVEGGGRFILGTFAVPATWKYVRSNATAYHGRDIEIATAARLSATFTYVTPVATAWPEDDETWRGHVADGGYYDNYGIVTAVQFLDDVLTRAQAERQPMKVAVVKIRASPASRGERPKDRQWWYQIGAPLLTLVNVRTAGQRERAEEELHTSQRYWNLSGFDVREFDFAFNGQETPLSWQLSKAEQAAITTEWQKNDAELRRLVAFGDEARRSVHGGPTSR